MPRNCSETEKHPTEQKERQDNRAGDAKSNRQGASKTRNKVSKGDYRLCQQLKNTNCYQEPFKIRIKSNKEVGYTDKQKRKQEENWKLCNLLGQEVNVCSIHAIVMLPQKQGELHAKHIDNCEHIGESQVCQEEEQDTVYIVNTILIHLLAKIDATNKESSEDCLKYPNLDYLWFPDHTQPPSP